MNVLSASLILALGLSADALACGYAAGASRLKVPLLSALAAAVVSAACIAVGMGAGIVALCKTGESVGRYVSFAILSLFALFKIAGGTPKREAYDCNVDRKLSVGEGFALGAAVSIDGLAAGFGYASSVNMLICTTVAAFVFSGAALYLGAKGGKVSGGGRAGNITAGIALAVLAAQKLIFG